MFSKKKNLQKKLNQKNQFIILLSPKAHLQPLELISQILYLKTNHIRISLLLSNTVKTLRIRLKLLGLFMNSNTTHKFMGYSIKTHNRTHNRQIKLRQYFRPQIYSSLKTTSIKLPLTCSPDKALPLTPIKTWIKYSVML